MKYSKPNDIDEETYRLNRGLFNKIDDIKNMMISNKYNHLIQYNMIGKIDIQSTINKIVDTYVFQQIPSNQALKNAEIWKLQQFVSDILISDQEEIDRIRNPQIEILRKYGMLTKDSNIESTIYSFFSHSIGDEERERRILHMTQQIPRLEEAERLKNEQIQQRLEKERKEKESQLVQTQIANNEITKRLFEHFDIEILFRNRLCISIFFNMKEKIINNGIHYLRKELYDLDKELSKSFVGTGSIHIGTMVEHICRIVFKRILDIGLLNFLKIEFSRFAMYIVSQYEEIDKILDIYEQQEKKRFFRNVELKIHQKTHTHFESVMVKSIKKYNDKLKNTVEQEVQRRLSLK